MRRKEEATSVHFLHLARHAVDKGKEEGRKEKEKLKEGKKQKEIKLTKEK